MSTLSIIGECMIELSGAPFSACITQNYGGDTLNTAVYLARLAPKHTVHYVTAVGEDSISKAIVNQWQTEGVGTDYVLSFPDKTFGLYWVVLDAKGERSFIYWRKESAASQWLKHERAEQVLDQLLTSDWVYLSGISLAILPEDDRAKLLNWLDHYKAQGGKIAFDSNYRKNLWPDQNVMQMTYRSMMGKTDLALLTIEDEAAIWGIDEAAVLKQLKSSNIGMIVLKKGGEGALILQHGLVEQVPAVKCSQIVDTTAAGDSFNAGVLAALINGQTIIDACQLGHKLASTVIQHKGAILPKEKMPTI